MNRKLILITIALVGSCATILAQKSRPISADLFGIFFEDISYSADGGLYAELVQNRSFEYSPAESGGKKNERWNAFTAWLFTTKGYGYGKISIETKNPLNDNNPHYLVIQVEEPGMEGVGITNSGFDGIVIRKGESYNFSTYIQNLSGSDLSFEVKLLGRKGDTLARTAFATNTNSWKKYTASLISGGSDDSCSIAIVCKSKGSFAIDMVSLFPKHTYNEQPNGLRADLAQAIAELHPRFMRFPGGCLVHGDGLGNMYRWKNTIGPIEERVEQRNIWGYHQTTGLGFYEYFRFCEDIGAKALPIVAAGVSCQNSGGTWRIGGTGQRAIPLAEMDEYIRDVLDLIEYANGDTTTAWGKKRAAAGHPAPFHLQYIGVGNEDKQTDDFRDRFKRIYDILRSKHPEITVVGTVGPFYKGEDFDLGWNYANQQRIPMVDEHYYETPQWFLNNQYRYDTYDRTKSKVYVGEYASQGNKLFNALAEAAYMTSLERNGDVVTMSSYAPLLAKKDHISWSPDLLFFDNATVIRTANYWVQQLFAANMGDQYYQDIVGFDKHDSTLAASCVKDSKTGDVILKIVNVSGEDRLANINLSAFKINKSIARAVILKGEREAVNDFSQPEAIKPAASTMKINKVFSYSVPAYSLTVIRIGK